MKEDTSTTHSASSSTAPSLRQNDSGQVLTEQAPQRFSTKILSKLDSIENLLKRKDDKPLTFREACKYLGYTRSYMYKLTYRKVIPHYKPTGKMIFFSKNELDEWIFKSRNKYSVVSSETKDGSNLEKDPNQIEMFHKEKVKNKKKKVEEGASTNPWLNSGHGSAQEIVIEFPLKSRRKTTRQAQGDKE